VNDIADPVVPLEITGLSAASGKTYRIARNLDNGAACYIDRGYKYGNVPDFIKGAMFVQTANGDKRISDDPFLTFQVNTPVTVYVAFDNRAQLPAWMDAFTDTGFDLNTDTAFSIYEKSFEKGSVQLGANGHDGSMYTVMVTNK
jgi:hypothetical protein